MRRGSSSVRKSSSCRKGAWAPYHAAEGLDLADARESVRRSIASAHGLATSGIREAARRVAEAGHELCGCAVLVGTGMPDWSTDEILAVHVRVHKAEGELFRVGRSAGPPWSKDQKEAAAGALVALEHAKRGSSVT